MKIRINGVTIDTNNIFKISPLLDFPYCDDLKIPKFKSNFKIHFYDEKLQYPLLVEIFPNTITDNHFWYKNEESFNEIIKIIETKIEEIYNSIIDIWSKNQSEIPSFKTY